MMMMITAGLDWYVEGLRTGVWDGSVDVDVFVFVFVACAVIFIYTFVKGLF